MGGSQKYSCGCAAKEAKRFKKGSGGAEAHMELGSQLAGLQATAFKVIAVLALHRPVSRTACLQSTKVLGEQHLSVLPQSDPVDPPHTRLNLGNMPPSDGVVLQ